MSEHSTPWCVDSGDRWCIIRSVSAVAQTTTTLCGFDVAIDSRREQRQATCPRCIEISHRNAKTNTHLRNLRPFETPNTP